MKYLLIFLLLVFLIYGIGIRPYSLPDFEEQTITVCVRGAVQDSKDIELPLHSTIEDALNLIQTEENADLAQLNPKQILNDRDVLEIPEQHPEILYRISINSADAETLTKLNGIGIKTAEKIVAYRTEHGLFQTIEEIMNVSGIGKAKYEKIRFEITL